MSSLKIWAQILLESFTVDPLLIQQRTKTPSHLGRASTLPGTSIKTNICHIIVL